MMCQNFVSIWDHCSWIYSLEELVEEVKIEINLMDGRYIVQCSIALVLQYGCVDVAAFYHKQCLNNMYVCKYA